jgi:glutathione S-transferase
MAAPRIVLHQWEMSPYCNKTRRCLQFKGLDYAVINYNGLDARKAAKLSPAGKLPVLDYDGERLQDSTRIAEFLDRRHPQRLLYPADPLTRAAARFWEDWAGSSLYFYEIYIRMLDPANREQALDWICEGRPRWERWVLREVFKRRYPKKLKAQGLGSYSRAEVEGQLMQHLEGLDLLLGERPYLTGADANIGDLSVAAQLSETLRTDAGIRKQAQRYGRLMAWLERC